MRESEHRRLQEQGSDQLKNTRNLWLYGQENLPESQAERFGDLKHLNLQTSRAWALKEVFRTFWSCPTVKVSERHFARWYSWAIRCRLEPVKKVARLCKRHLPNLITFFEHRLTNGPMEGLNNAIQGLIKKAFGYRNKERFKTDIFFHFGGLDLYPAQ